LITTKRVYKTLISVGCALLGVSVALVFVGSRAIASEQASTPGEKNLGVATLGMIFGMGIVATAGFGLVILLTGWTVLTVHRLRNPA
jgi:hypothetical protein